jgi:hypothetical protein
MPSLDSLTFFKTTYYRVTVSEDNQASIFDKSYVVNDNQSPLHSSISNVTVIDCHSLHTIYQIYSLDCLHLQLLCNTYLVLVYYYIFTFKNEAKPNTYYRVTVSEDNQASIFDKS